MVHLATLFASVAALLAVSAYNVTYDREYMIVDGKRKFFIGGDVHYARTAAGDWPAILDRAVVGGINLIQTYIFWAVHEPVRGQYNFEGDADLVHFLKLCAERDLPVYLRVGPYINAEFNLGGVPSWLLDIEGMKMRTNNDLWKAEMTKWVGYVLGKLTDAKMFAPEGGPIIMAQMENEYGYQNKGTASDMEYQEWYQDYALSLGIDIPWSICATPTNKPGILKSANFWDCPAHANATFNDQPAICTEYWGSWPMNWGSPHPLRPAANNAFSTARFFGRGGALIVYYPFAGGNSFDRMSGGAITANMATTYDFDGPLDEWNLPNEPKYSHLAKLHHLLLSEMEFIVAQTNVTIVNLDNNGTITNGTVTTAAVYYWGTPGKKCFALLENGGMDTKTLSWNGLSLTLPGWSISVLKSCTTEVFNTANVNEAPSSLPVPAAPIGSWTANTEPAGVWGEPFVALAPANQLRVTHDTTDYLWYVTEALMFSAGSAEVTVSWGGGDTLGGVYVNGAPACTEVAGFACTAHNLTLGVNTIAVLSETVGLPSFPVGADTQASLIKGIGGIQVSGRPLLGPWKHMPGLKGEAQKVFADPSLTASWPAVNTSEPTKPITWYAASADAPAGDAVALDLLGMNKGVIYVNGHNLGRYWMTVSPSDLCHLPCDYKGPYSRNQQGLPSSGPFAFCNDRCGEPSQRYYVVPVPYLTADRTNNHVVLFDERGGADISQVKFVSRKAN